MVWEQRSLAVVMLTRFVEGQHVKKVTSQHYSMPGDARVL